MPGSKANRASGAVVAFNPYETTDGSVVADEAKAIIDGTFMDQLLK